MGFNHLLGEMPLRSEAVVKNTIEIHCFPEPKVLLESSSQSVNGITPQGNNSFLFLSGLINFLPYGTWQAVTHVTFQSFIID